MHAGTLRALEFDRIVAVVTGLAVTPTGRDLLADLHPLTDAARVIAAQQATSEGTQFLADHPGFPLRAPADLEEILGALGVEGRALEPLRLRGLSDYLESIEQSRSAVSTLQAPFPILRGLVETVASFKGEVASARRKIDQAGEVVDDASPALAGIRERLRRQRAKLRTTLDGFLRNQETSKYLQQQVVTDRNGRYVLMVRAEHRSSIAGIVHGGSTSGASLFVEPLETVEINNDIVALEEQEAEEVRRILLALTDAFRARPSDLRRTVDVATALDVIQARARFAAIVGGVEPVIASDGSCELRAARHPLLMRTVTERLGTDTGFDRYGKRQIKPGIWSGPGRYPPDAPDTRARHHGSEHRGQDCGTQDRRATGRDGAGRPAPSGRARLEAPHLQVALRRHRRRAVDRGQPQHVLGAHHQRRVDGSRPRAAGLILLDEVGAGTDPAEGGALGIAVIDHFRRRGAHLVATTHYDSLKSYASTTEGVVSAAFGFNPENFAPTYRLVYGSPGRSLAIEIAARLGMPRSVIAAARENLTDREKQLAEHLARVDQDLRTLEQERMAVARERASVAETEKSLRTREQKIR